MRNHVQVVGRATVLLLLTSTVLGCESLHKSVILDEVTPPGEIEPPPAQVHSETQVRPYRPEPGVSGLGETTVHSRDPKSPHSAFETAYRKANQPRIALYVNRALSDDVREWVSGSRLKVGYVQTSTTHNGQRTTTETVGTATASTQTRSHDGAGRERTDHWIWRLEDAISQPFLDVGARLVDRAMIVRLASAQRGHNPHEDEPVKLIEMLGLKDAADILVEIEISACPDDRLGYVFRIRAVDITSGTVLTSTTSASWDRNGRVSGQWLATSEGYERKGLPKPEVVGYRLAEDIMNGLTSAL